MELLNIRNHYVTFANFLTLIRIILSYFLFHFIVVEKIYLALSVLLLAAVTELDGTIARKTNTQSRFGGYFDFTSDIVFTFSGLLALTVCGKLMLWHFIFFTICFIVDILCITRKCFPFIQASLPMRQWQRASGILPITLVFFSLIDVPNLDFIILLIIVLNGIRALNKCYLIIRGFAS